MQYQEKGLVYHVFDEEYDRVAAHAIAYSRKFTNLPICVVTNLSPDRRNEVWGKVSNVTFVELPLTVDDNREAKTSIIYHSPFHHSIYIDSDAVIQKPGIESLFDLFGNNDVILQLNSIKRVPDSSFFHKHYVPVLKLLNVPFPIKVYQGGFFAFRRTAAAKTFFKVWNVLWKMSGSGRDMPPLACTVRICVEQFNLKVKEIMGKDKFFASGGCSSHGDPEAIVQHRWSRGLGFFSKFKIPPYQPYKPFDGRGKMIYGQQK